MSEVNNPNISHFHQDGRDFYLLGTAHVSEASVQEVRAAIDELKPDVVCVELCEPRYKALTDHNQWKNLDIFQVIREGKTLFLLANLAVGAYQRRLGAKLGVKPGAELLEAAQYAEAQGVPFALIDREVHITLKRAWAAVPFLKKTQLLGAVGGSLFDEKADEEVDAQTIEDLKDKAHLNEIMQEFTKALPEVKGALIDERDQWMLHHMRQSEGQKVLAVVGAGHVPGMLARKDDPGIDEVEAIGVIPPTALWVKALKWLIPLLVLGAFYFGWSKGEAQTLEQMLYAWILPNAIFAGLLAALAGAKPLTTLIAAFASPITSLNPLINTGIVAGYVEAKLRKPTVEDAERINEDVQDFAGLKRNAFTRTLLVAFAATMGSALGGWIGATLVTRLLL